MKEQKVVVESHVLAPGESTLVETLLVNTFTAGKNVQPEGFRMAATLDGIPLTEGIEGVDLRIAVKNETEDPKAFYWIITGMGVKAPQGWLDPGDEWPPRYDQ